MVSRRDIILLLFLGVCWMGTLVIPYFLSDRVTESLSIELSPEHLELKNKTEMSLEELNRLKELDQKVMNQIEKSTREKGFSISFFRNEAVFVLAVGWLLIGFLIKQLSYLHLVFVFVLFCIGAILGLVTVAELVIYSLIVIAGFVLRTKIVMKGTDPN